MRSKDNDNDNDTTLEDSFKTSARNEMRELRRKLKEGGDDLSILDVGRKEEKKAVGT